MIGGLRLYPPVTKSYICKLTSSRFSDWKSLIFILQKTFFFYCKDNKIVISFFNCSIQPISVVLDASESCQMVNFNIGGSTSTTRKWDIKGAEYLFFLLSFPQNEQKIDQFCTYSFAQFVYFLRVVCLLFNF